MKHTRSRLFLVFGIVAVSVYLVAAATARFFYPTSFGPSGNWLSDLGNNDLNPAGALYYRLGGILGGSGLLAFFLSLDGRSWGERRVVRTLSILVRVFGAMASLCFIMTGVFSEDMMPMHSWFSMANFAAFGTAIALTGIARLCRAALPSWFALFCFAAWGFDLASAILGQARWLEWVVVLLLITYVVSWVVISVYPARGHYQMKEGNTNQHGVRRSSQKDTI